MDKKRWIPAPRRYVSRAMRTQYTRQNPAADVVGYLYVWSLLQDGDRPKRRDVANDLGWTEHKARVLVAEVKVEFTEWQALTATSRPKPPKIRPNVAQDRPTKPSKNDDLTEPTAQESPTVAQESPLTRAGSTVQIKDNTKTTNDPVCNRELESNPSTGLAFPARSERGESPPVNAGPYRQKGGALKKPAVDVAAVWDRLEDIRLEHTVGSKRRKVGQRRAVLKARINEHGVEAIVNAWLWWHKSDDRRARFLRANYRYKTFFVPGNLREYVDLADDWTNQTEPVDVFDRANFDENGNLIESEAR